MTDYAELRAYLADNITLLSHHKAALLDLVDAKIAVRSPTESTALANVREAWAALAMIRETVETLAPIGAVKGAEYLDGPTFVHEAEALVEGIRKLAEVRS